MKKTILVTIEKEIVVDIPDEFLTEDEIASFERIMFKLEGDKVEALFKYAGEQYAQYPEFHIEGLDLYNCHETGFTEIDSEIVDE